MPLTAKTLAEMKAGAQTLADKTGMKLSAADFARILTIHERQMVLQEWEGRGWINIIKNRVRNPKNEMWITTGTTYTIPRMGATFEEPEAERLGSSPTELLIARIALALASQGLSL